MNASITVLEHFAPLAAGHPVLFCDIWGVIHNGREAIAPAVDCLIALRRQGHLVVLISNSPRPSGEIPAQFDEIGVDHGCYDAIVTSGDATRDVIRAHGAGGTIRIHHIGPERDRPLFHGLPATLTGVAEADIVVCTGLVDDEAETPADYEADLEEIAALGKDFVCANPDKVVQRGDKLVYCAGALAEKLENLGGAVIAPGKPHRPIYDLCLRRAGELTGRDVPKSQILAIGDGLNTDIRGAAQFGIACLFIASGIHGADLASDRGLDAAALARALAGLEKPPIAVMRHLTY